MEAVTDTRTLKVLQEGGLLPTVPSSISQMPVASELHCRKRTLEEARSYAVAGVGQHSSATGQAGLLGCSASSDWARQEHLAGITFSETCCVKPGKHLYKFCHRNLGTWLNFTGPIFVLIL